LFSLYSSGQALFLLSSEVLEGLVYFVLTNNVHGMLDPVLCLVACGNLLGRKKKTMKRDTGAI